MWSDIYDIIWGNSRPGNKATILIFSITMNNEYRQQYDKTKKEANLMKF